MSWKHYIKGQKRLAKRAARTIQEQLAIKELLEGKKVVKSKTRKRAEQVRNADTHRKNRETALEAEVRRDQARSKARRKAS